MHQDTNTKEQLYDDFIVSLMEQVRALARKYSRNSSRVEDDDLFSIGMVKICEVAERAQTAPNPCAYALRSAENAIIAEYNHVHRLSPLSLDAPLTSDDVAFTLLDIFAAPTVASTVESVYAGELRDALARLGARQRETLQGLYGFEGCGVGTQTEVGRDLGITRGCASFHATRGRQALRKDAALCQAVGVVAAQ